VPDPALAPALLVEVLAEGAGWAGHPGLAERIEGWLGVAAAERAPEQPCEVTVLLTDDARQRELNRRWRGKDAATNVLSFPAAAAAGLERRPLGDIALAYETLAREAEAADRPFDAHLAHLVVHGYLHLLGYDHENDTEAELMEDLESRLLERLGFPDPY